MKHARTLQAVLGAAAVAAGTALFAPSAQAAPVNVPCDETALVQAINDANANPDPDVLNLTPGCTYNLTTPHGGADNGLPVITTPIELVGQATVSHSSMSLFRIATVNPTGALTLTRVAFTLGYVEGNGGGILNYGDLTLNNAILAANSSSKSNGGGLANVGTATFKGGVVSMNWAPGGGGGIYNFPNGTLKATGLAVTSNSAGRRGGGIAAVDSATTLTDTALTYNGAGVAAGNVYRQGGTMTVTDSAILVSWPNNCTSSIPAVPTCVA